MDGESSFVLWVKRIVAYFAPNGKGVHREQQKPNDFILTPKPVAADHILPWQFQTPEAFVEKNYNKQKRKQVLFASVFSRNCAECQALVPLFS